MQPHPQLHGYVLAGGQSSRMGTDKAVLPFSASTLLSCAATTLAPLCADVTLLGAARPAFPHLRAIIDRVTSAGPVGGIEAALADLAARHGLWALFLPVDAPLLPPGLLGALVTHWLAQPCTRIAFPVVAGRPQPVISLIHVTALESITHSLASGQHRLRVALALAADALALHLPCPPDQVLRTPALSLRGTTLFADEVPLPWQPSPQELALSDLWFANANTPPELERLRLALALNHPY